VIAKLLNVGAESSNPLKTQERFIVHPSRDGAEILAPRICWRDELAAGRRRFVGVAEEAFAVGFCAAPEEDG
jgi:hypothetical protein